MAKKSLGFKLDIITPALTKSIEMWADARTSATSKRRHDLLRDKYNALLGDGKDGTAAGFFVFSGVPIEQVTPAHVKEWQQYMEDMELSAASVYSRVSRLSSYYDWLMKEPDFKERLSHNPAKMARPKAPKAYQSEKAKSLSDDDVKTLLHFVYNKAQGDDLSARRDYALLRFYFATGKRRSEIINLRWRDIEMTDNGLVINTEEKGGLYRATEIMDTGVKNALLAYLKASERRNKETNKPSMGPGVPRCGCVMTAPRKENRLSHHMGSSTC